MKNVLFAVLAAFALAMALPSAHADEAPVVQTSAAESLPGDSVTSSVGKFVGTAIVSPLTLVKKVAPAALDGVKSIAGDFKDGFLKGVRSEEGTAAAAPTADEVPAEAFTQASVTPIMMPMPPMFARYAAMFRPPVPVERGVVVSK